jgi:hypothetical protein
MLLYEIDASPAAASATRIFSGRSRAMLGAGEHQWRSRFRIAEDQQLGIRHEHSCFGSLTTMIDDCEERYSFRSQICLSFSTISSTGPRCPN